MERPAPAAIIGASLADRRHCHRLLLQSIAVAACTFCSARACSIQRLDAVTDELAFEAVAGEGYPALIGQQYPASQGIAGWTLTSQQAVVVDDVSANPNFARDLAESTGYVPRSIISLPLVRDDTPLGVLQVLDAATGDRAALDALEFCSPFADQASFALHLIELDREMEQAVNSADGELRELMELSRALSFAGGGKRSAAIRLLYTVRELLGAED